MLSDFQKNLAVLEKPAYVSKNLESYMFSSGLCSCELAKDNNCSDGISGRDLARLISFPGVHPYFISASAAPNLEKYVDLKVGL